MARVQLQNISKTFPGNVRAVDGVSLDIADREFVVLVGPSGCGKTTVLRMVAGLEEITSGTIRIGDRVVNEVQPKDRDIAMVFQNYALYPHMSVFQNMAFGLKLRGMARGQIEQRVTETAKLLEIDHLLDRKPKALSGGQKQRVAVGRAIVREPAAFLFDEPLSNLDARLRVATRAELKRLHQRLRTTTLYVTHDQEEAMTLGDRIVVMKDGRVQQSGAPLDAYNKPVNRFVAGFLGTPPMNFIDGAIKAANGKLTFHEGKVVARQLTLPPAGFTFELPSALAAKMRGQVDRHVVLGLRPEHIRLRQLTGENGGVVDAGDLAARIGVTVNVIEPLGGDMDLYLSTSLNETVVGRVKAEVGLIAGSALTVFVEVSKAHFFEPAESGMNLVEKASVAEVSSSASSELTHAR
jgi:multiple sugar transport system ATP-binding protein